MPFENWDDVGDALLHALGHLSDGDFLILGEPTADPLPRRGLFGRRAKPAAARYVQVLRIQDLYTAECVGATSLGGTWDMGEATIERLRDAGLAHPRREQARVRRRSPPTSTCTSPSPPPRPRAALASLAASAPARDLVLQTSGARPRRGYRPSALHSESRCDTLRTRAPAAPASNAAGVRVRSDP